MTNSKKTKPKKRKTKAPAKPKLTRGRPYLNGELYADLANMKTGDSKFFDGQTPESLAKVRRMCKILGMRIVMRRVVDELGDITGTRMWAAGRANAARVRRVLGNLQTPLEEDDEL